MENRKVLLVDDEADLLEVMKVRIRGWGYDVIEAAGGEEAISLVTNQKPDIVVLDYKMADMDGVSVLKEIRKFDQKIPVIMFTAYPEADVQRDAQSLDVSAFIPKLSAYQDAHNSLESALDIIRQKITASGQ
jgi:CheY-like chemotaxis protein